MIRGKIVIIIHFVSKSSTSQHTRIVQRISSILSVGWRRRDLRVLYIPAENVNQNYSHKCNSTQLVKAKSTDFSNFQSINPSTASLLTPRELHQTVYYIYIYGLPIVFTLKVLFHLLSNLSHIIRRCIAVQGKSVYSAVLYGTRNCWL